MSEPSAITQRDRPDMRLFGFAVGVWASTLGALYASVLTALAIAVAAAVVAAAVGALSPAWLAGRGDDDKSGSRLTRIAVIILIGVICGSTATVARTAARTAEPLATLARDRATVTIEVTISGDPHRLDSASPGPVTYLVPARLRHLTGPEGQTAAADVRVVIFGGHPGWRALLPSHTVRFTGRLGEPRRGDLTAAVISTTTAPTVLGGPSWAQTAAGRLRAGLQDACAGLRPEPGGLLPGLVIGDTSRLDPGVEQDFTETGLTHLVAVSGSNVLLILGVVLFAARWCRAGPWMAAALCGIALIGFVILARPSSSVVRAAAMGAVGLVALVAGRPRSAAPALATAVVAGLLIDPALANDAGFALSVCATGGLVLLAPSWRDALRARGWPPGVAEAVAVPAAAQVACGPVIAALSGSVSLIAVPANLLAVPAVAPATLFGVAAAVLSAVWPAGAEFAAWLASWPAQWLVQVAHVGSGVPTSAVPWPAGVTGGLLLAAITAAALAAGRWPALRRIVIVALVAGMVASTPIRLLAPGWPPAGAVVVACDVGQGDGLVLPTGPGRAVVVDSGPEPVGIDGCLRRLGVSHVVLFVATHLHVDHIGGLAGVGRGRRVDAVLAPDFDEPAAGARSMTATAAAWGATLTRAAAGWTGRHGEVSLTLIGPTRRLTGTRSDVNNNSVLIRAESRGVVVLLGGDAENEQQRVVLTDADRRALRADILKVPHHGSAYQETELLDTIAPRVVLVSVGADNRYGHPNPALMAWFARHAATVRRTDLDGDIAVVVVDGELRLVARGRSRSP